MKDGKHTPKWTELEHLPRWDEEFYEVWTGKKHGKWLMMKTLRPEIADKPEMRDMIEREFDTRYNLAHPNIVMVNDFGDVPGVGRCIICDDVFGRSLREIIDAGEVTEHHLRQLRERLPAALQYIQENRIAHHPIIPERIIFTDKIENLKLIDVGFEQRPALKEKDAAADIDAYGHVIAEALKGLKPGVKPSRTMIHVADRCMGKTSMKPYRTISEMQNALDRRQTTAFLWAAIIFLLGMVIWLVCLNT